MSWIRSEELPEKIKVSFEVSVKDHPELARFIWSLPYRSASKTLRDILSAAVKSAGGGAVTESTGKQASPGSSEGGGGSSPPGVQNVSEAAADAIRRFDSMFSS